MDVTVVIPAYNSAATLQRALQSVFAQTVSPAQVIVVDDGSSDDPAAALAPWQARVQLVRQANAGAAAARNHGVSLACTPWVAFLDADDYWHPDKLRRQVQALAQQPQLQLCCTGFRNVSADDPLLPWPALNDAPVLIDRAFSQTFEQPYLATPTVVLRRDAFEQAGGFREGLRTAEDVDLWLRLAWRHPIGRLPATLVTVVVTPGSTTARRQDGVFIDNLQVIDQFIADHPQFAQRHWASVRRARAKVLEDWGSQALSGGDASMARSQLLASLRQRPAVRPALLLAKALLAAALPGILR